MQEKPLVTVIVPSYNSPDLFQSLYSVLEQDYPRIQLILADDASDNFVVPEVDEYLRKNNRGNIEQYQILVNSRNEGTVYTINNALINCMGEYIFILAGDDCFYDHMVLSDWVAEFIKTGALVMTGYRAVFDPSLQSCFGIEPTQDQVIFIKTLAPEKLFEKIAEKNFIFGCCTARSSECIRKYGYFDQGCRLVEDHPMNLKLLRMGEPIHFIDRIVVKYRKGGASSPLRFNPVYAQDVDRILHYDVLPYTKRPVRMRWIYFQWKRDQRLLQKRAKTLSRYHEHRLICSLIQIQYYMHHPFRTLFRFPRYIAKKIKKENHHGGTDENTLSNLY